MYLEENDFIHPLLQVGSGSGEKSTDPEDHKSPDPDLHPCHGGKQIVDPTFLKNGAASLKGLLADIQYS